MVGYGLSLLFQFTNPDRSLGGHEPVEGHGGPAWTGRTAIIVLLMAAGLLALLSEILVGAIEPFVAEFGLSEFFVGVVLIPTIGNLAEHLVAVQLAFKNKMEFAMAVCYGSSLQVALFVAPVLVLTGVVIGQPMDLVFEPLEVAAVGAAVGISALIALDGESNWLEGALLICLHHPRRSPSSSSSRAGGGGRRGGRRHRRSRGGGEANPDQAAATGSAASSISSSSSTSNPSAAIGSLAGASP